jgi:lysophospholipase L1-like esterase
MRRLAAVALILALASAHEAPLHAAAKKKQRKTRKATAAPRPAPLAPAARQQVLMNVAADLAGADGAPENPRALVPFFEQLWRHQNEAPASLHILHYGDSHTAADDWTGTLRYLFQTKFGDGGPGYSLAGHPYRGYRRLDLRSWSSRGWYSDGLVGRSGDGRYGLGGVSLTTARAGETVTLSADCRRMELFYLQQPGGGDLQLFDNGVPVERISTQGALGPGYFEYTPSPGLHEFELRTLSRAPVRLFGWVTENGIGFTYETLGINGAQASIGLNWDPEVLASNIARRNPALIVLAYGTNEAGQRDWTFDTYRAMFSRLLQRFRAAAPAASILVVGPPDRMTAVRRRWIPYYTVGMITEAQRQAAEDNGCAFFDLRTVMGGEGAMEQWVAAGLAQNDHVHLTSEGYRLIAQKLFQSLMNQYATFVRVRQQVLGAAEAGAPGER